jgi:AraC-like DNA-binding protein
MFAAGAEARGLDVAPIFAASGIDRAALQARGARVAATTAMDVWARSTRALGDPTFALTMGERLPLAQLNLIDYLAITSANVGDALARVARYAPLMSDAERLTLSVHGHEARFRFHHQNELPYPIEMIVGLFLERARSLHGPAWSVKRVSFAHAALGARVTYDRICQAPIEFEAPFTEVVFERDLMTEAMAGANARLNAILGAEADAALAALMAQGRAPSFVAAVKRVLDAGLDQRDFTLTRLADQLGVSARTLQRRLRAAGLTHRGLVRDVRRDVATRSLAARVSKGQIARTLGYSGASAFQRAFKLWSGFTPAGGRRKATPRR